MINYIKGNLLDSTCNYICHQVNCQGVMGSGVASQIRAKWPNVYSEYLEKCKNNPSSALLSSIQFIKIADWEEEGFRPSGQWVVNMFSQENYGYDDIQYTSYDAFWECLNWLKSCTSPKYDTIAFPKGIGCGLGGANWDVIEKMIDVVFNDYSVYIYEYETRRNEYA